jgi:hypothetical protein
MNKKWIIAVLYDGKLTVRKVPENTDFENYVHIHFGSECQWMIIDRMDIKV